MDFNASPEEQARVMLLHMREVEHWIKTSDERGIPYVRADAVRIVKGKAQFHKDRFLHVYASELMSNLGKKA